MNWPIEITPIQKPKNRLQQNRPNLGGGRSAWVEQTPHKLASEISVLAIDEWVH